MKGMNIILFVTLIQCSDHIFIEPRPLKRRKIQYNDLGEKHIDTTLDECRLMVIFNNSSFIYKGSECKSNFVIETEIRKLNINKEEQDEIERVRKEISCQYKYIRDNIMNIYSISYDDLQNMNIKRFVDLIYTSASLFEGEITEEKYLECCSTINEIILTRHRLINKKCVLKYIGSILKSPSKLDLIAIYKFPELIGMMFCVVNKHNSLRNKDIISIMVHYNAIKLNIQHTLTNKYKGNVRNVDVQKLTLGSNYKIPEGLYVHVERMYSILNNQDLTFIGEYNEALNVLLNRFSGLNLNSIMICFKMILFLIDKNKLSIFKEFFGDCRVFTSLEYLEILGNNECLVCSTVGQILRKCFGIFLSTMDLLNKSDPKMKQIERLKPIYSSLLEEKELTDGIMDISYLVSLIFNIFKMNISDDL